MCYRPAGAAVEPAAAAGAFGFESCVARLESQIMESEHAPLRIQVPHLREELRDAAPDDGRRSGTGVPGMPVRGGRAAAFALCHERMRDIPCREVHLSAVDDGRSA